MTEQGGKGERRGEECQRPGRCEEKGVPPRVRKSESQREKADPSGWVRERNIFPGGTRITVETRKIMKLVLKSVKVNII